MKQTVFLLAILLIATAVVADWTIVASYTIPGKASGLAYDGTYFYFGIYGAGGENIYRFDPSDGTYQLQFTNPQIGDSYGMTYDGEYLWIIDRESPSTTPAYALQLDLQGNIISEFDLPDFYMSGIAYDDGDFWVQTYHPNPGTVYKVDNTGTILTQFTPPDDQPWDICLHDDDLWIVDYWVDGVGKIHKVDQSGSLLESHDPETQRPAGIVYDGTYLWYVDGALGSDSNLYKVDLAGTGTPQISVPFDQYDFGNVVIDESITVDVPITNTGTGTLVVDDLIFASDVFSTDETLPISIDPGDTYSCDITFTPDDWGEHIADFTIVSNDPINPNTVIELHGYGLYPEAHIIADPTSLSYGSVRVGAHTGQFVQLSNQGVTQLTINDISFGDVSFFYDDTVELPITLASREEYDLRVWFHPSSTTTINTEMSISSNDPTQATIDVDLSGSGDDTVLEIGDLLWSFDIDTGYFLNIRAISPIPDIWGNGLSDVVICSDDNHVRAFNGNSDGIADILWEYEIPAGSVYSQKGLAVEEDLNNDGYLDVVIGTTGGDRAIRALSGKTGEQLWVFNTNMYGGGGWVYQVDVRYDYTGDGVKDVLASAGDDGQGTGPKRVFLLEGATGQLVWDSSLNGPGFSVIGVEDFNGDGVPDVIAGASNQFETEGRVFGICGATGSILWTHNTAGTSVWALAQIDDITGNDISDVMAGAFMANGAYYGLDVTNGEVEWSGNTGAAIITRLVPLDDVNFNGSIDIAVAHSSSNATVIDGYDGVAIWNQQLADGAWHLAKTGDLTGNGINDLVIGTLYQNNNVYFVDATTGNPLETIPYPSAVDAIGTIPDVVGNGSWEMVAGGRNGQIRCYTGGYVEMPDPGYIGGNVTLVGGEGDVTEVEITAGTESTNPDENGNYTLEILPGTYTVMASLDGYETASQSEVEVVSGEATIVDFTLYADELPMPINLTVDSDTGEFIWDAPEFSRRSHREVLEYNVYLDGEEVGTTEEEIWTYEELENGVEYEAGVSAVYEVGESDVATITFVYTGTDADETIVTITELRGNHPNPFNPDTNISFSIKDQSNVTIEVFNIKGEKIRTLIDKELPAGHHSVVWDGRNQHNREVSSGVYFYRMRAGKYASTRKMILMK